MQRKRRKLYNVGSKEYRDGFFCGRRDVVSGALFRSADVTIPGAWVVEMTKFEMEK